MTSPHLRCGTSPRFGSVTAIRVVTRKSARKPWPDLHLDHAPAPPFHLLNLGTEHPPDERAQGARGAVARGLAWIPGARSGSNAAARELKPALVAGIPLTRIAELTGVSRQTLYRARSPGGRED